MSSGGKGIPVVIPVMLGRESWCEVVAACEYVAERLLSHGFDSADQRALTVRARRLLTSAANTIAVELSRDDAYRARNSQEGQNYASQ